MRVSFDKIETKLANKSKIFTPYQTNPERTKLNEKSKPNFIFKIQYQ